jgi:acyl-CoA synthetase (AMP-forming)/AMP-acid ligase II
VFVHSILDTLAERFSRPAFLASDRIVTFSELRELSFKLAAALRGAGAGKGSHVAILLPDSVDFYVAYAAIWSLGAVAVPLNMGMKPDTATRLLSHSDSEFLILHDSYPADAARIKKAVPSIRWVTGSSPAAAGKPGAGADADLESIFSADTPHIEPPDIAETDTCGIFYTSGTTGTPKGIVWNYRHLDAPLMILKHFLKMPGDDVQICAVPLSHAGGLVYLLGCLKWGLPTVLMERFVPGAFLRSIEKHRATMCFLVPAMFGALVRSPEFASADLSSLRWVATFGAVADLASLEKLQAKCPELIIINGWGTMEAAPPNTIPHLDREEIDLRGVGFPAPWIEIKVLDEDGEELPPGEVGEVVLRGWVVMNGYYKEPRLTAETVRDGYLHTGDLGRFDERGYLYIVGRKKDVIIVGGFNVQADEVEQVLASHPAVAQVAVTGVRDRTRGETVKAHVVLAAEALADERELTGFCRSRLEAHKVPRVFVFLDRLPRTATGKVAKWQLK